MRPARIALVIVGVLAFVVGGGSAVGGVLLLGAHGTQRDASGFYSTATERFETPTFALTSTEVDLHIDPVQPDGVPFEPDLGTVRLEAARADDGAVFIGIAPTRDAEAYLAEVAYDEVTEVELSPLDVTYRRSEGEQAPAPPMTSDMWAASAYGVNTQTLTWDVEQGRWTVVVMNADASPGVLVDLSVGARTGLLLPIGVGLSVVGLLLVLAAVGALIAATRGAPDARSPVSVPAPGVYPMRVVGQLDDRLSRWLWLVKWVLAIPHFIVLAFLWVAFSVLTVVAGVAILFTGRYPRGIFYFNVGVLRWSWRVAYYCYGVLGTDRYPPFSLAADPDYGADLTVDYPERLSRGLVLVKWWLLAIPHYLIVAVLTGGTLSWTVDEPNRGALEVTSGGLIGLLVLVAAIALAATGRYPRGLYDLVMGLQRWVYRVIAYAALMTDRYPPFRLDSGGSEPSSGPQPPRDPDDRAVAERGLART